MSSVQSNVSDMLITVKSREVQRGMLADRTNDAEKAAQHFLAAAHLELVLASDYEALGDPALARRSRISAASCFWRAGRQDQAALIFDALTQADPGSAGEVADVIHDLQANTRN